jgi:serine/threonine protein kinase/tetratricopeptide (TPR) repeat protein
MLPAISQYRVCQKIGEGGMGAVFEGWDERLQRRVAIKTLREAAGSEEAKSRLWREARSLARISHPRVCQIYDVLEAGSDLFLILEFLEGTSLTDRLTSAAVLTGEALTIEQQILEALEALHRNGIVHRDLKPSNVFLTPHGVKLLDFGLARSVEPQLPGRGDGETATVLTMPGMIVGTPNYMAPEQVRGGAVGPLVDIFAAGCVLYEMLAGRQPFQGASCVDVLYTILHFDPPPLGGSREIEVLDHVIRRAISKRPEERFASAEEMLHALNRVAITSSTAASISACAVRRVIALPFTLLTPDPEIAFLERSLPEAISNSLSGIDNLIVRSSMLANQFGGKLDLKQIAGEAGVDAVLVGSVTRAGDRLRLACQLVEAPAGTLVWGETINSSLSDLFRVQDELCERVVRALRVPFSEREQRTVRRDVPADAKAFEYYLRANQIALVRNLDNMRVARELYLECLELDPQYAAAWARLGRVNHFLEKFGDEADRNQTVEECFQKAFNLNPDLPIAHNLYTSIECDQGHALTAMLRLLKRASFRRNDADLFAGLVQACRYCGELEASVAAHFRARHLDPHVVTSVAHTYFLLGQYQKAVEFYGHKGGYYIDCAALAALGDRSSALERLRKREKSGGFTGSVQAIMQSLRASLEGNREECLAAIHAGSEHSSRDPETLYYMGRHLAQVNEAEAAAEVLTRAVEHGYLCEFGLANEGCFAALRASPQYLALSRFADERSEEAHRAFLEAGGPGLLNLPQAAATVS